MSGLTEWFAVVALDSSHKSALAPRGLCPPTGPAGGSGASSTPPSSGGFSALVPALLVETQNTREKPLSVGPLFCNHTARTADEWSALRDTESGHTYSSPTSRPHPPLPYTAPWGAIEIRFRLLRAQSGTEMPPLGDRSRNQQKSRRLLCLARR